MQYLNTQAEFEVLWTAPASTATATLSTDASNNSMKPWLVYFTKNDCPPCQLLDKDALVSAALLAGLPFYVVNQSINNYTPGFCSVYRFPTFAIIKNRKILGKLTSSKTAAVIDWINDFVSP
jgi:hypothetical protein